jgi:hypothetical protein
VAAAVTVSTQGPIPTSVTDVPETVQIVPADVVPKVKDGLGAFDVAASVTGPDPNTTLAGTVPANAIVCATFVIVSVCVTGVITAA